MNKKITFLMTAMVLILAIMGPRSVAWGQTDYSGTFTRITSADDFATGYYVVTGAGTTKALGNTANSNKRIEGVNVTINENSITNPSNSVVYYITRTENTCTFQNVGNSKYMYQAATTSGKGMGFRDNSANITFEGWTSGGTGTSAYEGFAFTLNGTSNNKLKYNKNSAWFANYDNDYSNTMLPVDLYKLATNSPTCTIDPTSHDFGEITVGGNATFDFTVTTANLTEDLTLAVSEGFSVNPATIYSTETETTVTVTCAPTAVGALNSTLTISGGGLTDDVTATLSATGIGSEQYTITYSAANGTEPEAQQVTQGSTVTLPTINDVDCNTWQFAGWSESENSTEAPTLMAGDEYTPIDNVTFYAVYKKQTGSETADYTLQYDNWTYSGTTTNKTSYRLFGNGAYIQSAESHDLSNVTAVKITMRTFGGGDYKNVNIEDASGNVWGNAAATDNTLTEITATKTNGLTGNGKLRIKSKSGNGTGTGVGISKVVYTVNNTSYTYSTDPDCSTPVATPTITPNGGEFIGSQVITLACATEGATILYTTDDWSTSNTYSASFTITATTTLKVKATKDGMSESEVATATFTKIQALETIQAIFDASANAGNYYVTFNNWVVSGVNGSNAYVTDGTKGFIVYKSGHGFAVGDKISGTAQLALTRYNGAAEFTNLTATTQGISVTQGGTVTPVEMNIAELGGVNTGAVITVNNVEYTGSDIFSDGTNTIKAYNTFITLPSFTNGDRYNITGVYIQYNTTKEIAPRSETDIQLIVAAPTFTPEGGNYNAAQNVEIASATAGAAIYYTLDGSDPTVESTLYSAPIELTSNTTLKAIAAKAGSVSEIATAVYTITITTVATPTFEPEGGSYFNESLEVSLDCATNGATIVYTTDNWSTQTTYSNPFTITETTTVKAKATKADMDDSEIAEATYTKRYKVNFVVNGDGLAVSPSYVTPGEAISTLPTATAPNGYTFRGWSANEVALTNVEPTYVTAETIPTGDMTLKAVFAIAETGGTTSVTKDIIAEAGITASVTLNETAYQIGNLPIQLTATKGTSNWPVINYNANNGNDLRFYKSSSSVTFATTNNSTITKIEFKKNESTASDLKTYFSVNVGTLSGNVWTGSANSVTISFSNNDNFKEQMYIINVTYSETSPSTYSNFCTTVSSPEILAEITGNVTIPSGAAYTLTSPITIKSGATLTINGVLGNTNASLLVIEDGGQLICNNEVSATVRKSISGYTVASGEGADGWYIVSAPITDATASMAATGTYDLYTHDEAHYMWRNYQVTANQTTYDWFTSGYGYLYANAANTTLQFAGTVAAEGQKEVNLTCAANDATHGWNLLGNHTTHNIFFTGNNIEDGYYVMNAAGNAYESRLTSVPVAPCEGFFVKATSNTTVTLNPQPVSKSEEETPAIIETRVTETANANYSDVAYIVKGHGNNLTKISFGETTPSLFFAENGKDYAITHISDETEVLPLYFKASANANYTLNFNIDGEEFDYVVLNDMKTGAQIDLLENSSYSFDATTEDDENRFNIVFVASATESISENMDQPFAYRSGNEFIISSNGTLQIIDALGRVISTQAVSGSARVNVGNLTQGTYIMRLIGDNTVRTQKIVVK